MYAVLQIYLITTIHLQWFTDSPSYSSSEQLRKTRHKRAVTPPELWKMWDISFPESDNEEEK